MKVCIYGGGVAGLTAAHELVERGVDVEIFERRIALGGKARSYHVTGLGPSHAGGLPGEHGFRFFPGFYAHLDDTLRRIPDGRGGTVLDHLVVCPRGAFYRRGRAPLTVQTHFPRRLQDVPPYLGNFARPFQTDMSVGEIAFFWRRIASIMTSCEARRFDHHERMSWSEFLDASPEESSDYAVFLVQGWARSFVALDARRASARTMGITMGRMLLEFSRPGSSADRVLDGPTSDVWIEPWERHLVERGVKIHRGSELEGFEVHGGKVHLAWIRDSRGGRAVRADAHVCALPPEVVARIATPDLVRGAPSIGRVSLLETRRMLGVQLFCDRPLPLPQGHCHFADTAWGITAISQATLWRPEHAPHIDGRPVGAVLSTIAGDTTHPGSETTALTAAECSAGELGREIWAQIAAHLPVGALDRTRVLDVVVDPEVVARADADRLFVNTVGSWENRPEPTTELSNLFLAGDYVRTGVDVACMEGANESARLAVNAWLDQEGSRAPRCRIVEPQFPFLTKAGQRADRVLHRLGVRRGRGRRPSSPGVAS